MRRIFTFVLSVYSGLCRFRPTPYTINPAGGLRTKVGTLTGADSSGVPLLAMSASRGVWCRG